MRLKTVRIAGMNSNNMPNQLLRSKENLWDTKNITKRKTLIQVADMEDEKW